MLVLQDGLKMGKSLGNVLDPVALVQAYGADAGRFFVLKEVDFGQVGQPHDHPLPTHKQGDGRCCPFRPHAPCM